MKCAAFLGPGSSDERPTTSFLASFRKIAHEIAHAARRRFLAGERALRFHTESGLAFRQLFPISNRLSLTSQDNLVKLTHTPASICTHPTVSSRARWFDFTCADPIILLRGNAESFCRGDYSVRQPALPQRSSTTESPCQPPQSNNSLQPMKFEESVRSVRFLSTDLALFRKMRLAASSGRMDYSCRGCTDPVKRRAANCRPSPYAQVKRPRPPPPVPQLPVANAEICGAESSDLHSGHSAGRSRSVTRRIFSNFRPQWRQRYS